MKFLIAMLKHETNTFSPIVCDLARFRAWGLQEGEDVVRAYRGTGMPIGAYLDLAAQAGADIVTPLAAEAMPSGPLTAETFETLVGKIVDAVDGSIDAAFLDLHGAMVSETTPDGEGTLLAAIRAKRPDLPIAVTCDLHANLTEAMVENATALIGYKTYPHTDMATVGRQVGQILLDHLAGKVDPVMAWGQVPVLSQTLRQGTDDSPMAETIALTREIETEGALAATVFGGFALADIPDAGASAVVIADRDRGAATGWRDRLLSRLWADRAEHQYRHRPLADALAGVKALPADKPIILLDHADNCGSGGTQDVMTVLEAVLEAGLERVAMAAVWDPQAVLAMQQAGVGREVTLDLGGKSDMPALGLRGTPLRVTGTVRTLTDGRWTVHGPMYTGVEVTMGPSAVLEVGGCRIVIVSHHHEPWDLGVFTSMGIVPDQMRYLLLKSRIHYRAGFGPIADHHIPLDGAGVTTSDTGLLTYRAVRRPIYPLDTGSLDQGPFALPAGIPGGSAEGGA